MSESVEQMQAIEQNLSQLLSQRQQFQQQLAEVTSALEESKKSGKTYKILGNVLVEVAQEKILKELEDKKEVVTLRIKNIEKQEQKLKEKQEGLQKEALDALGGKDE